MNNTDHHAPIRRILLALDTATHNLSAFEAATALAARLDAEVHALFVEDINLLRLAALPFARETRLTSATTHRLQNPDMKRALRAEAERAQAILATVATRLNVRWSFRVTRGQIAEQVRAAAMETDLVALTSSGGMPVRLTHIAATIEMVISGAPCPLLMLPRGASIRPPFVAVQDGTPASLRALRLAVRLAQAEGVGVGVLLAAPDPAMARRLRAESDSVLADVVARYQVLFVPDVAAIARAVCAESAGTLLMAADSPVFDGAARRRLLEKLACAAFLTR
jgi:nucleotide-binding universal stress UspA family protein